MTINDLKDQKAVLIEEMRGIKNTVEAETRSMSAEERSDFDKKSVEVEDINRDIRLKEIENDEKRNNADNNYKKIENENMEKRTLTDIAKEAFENKGQADIEIEARAMDAKTFKTIETEQMDVIQELSQELTATQLGAEMVSGLTSNKAYPILSNMTAAWLSENEEVPTQDITSALMEIKPFRIGARINVSKQMLLQSSVNMDADIRRKIVVGLKQTLEDVLYSVDAATAKSPAGLLNGMTALSAGSEVDYKAIVALESKVYDDNALEGSLKYITNGKGSGELKTTTMDAGSGRFLLENGSANGFGVVKTNKLASNFGVGTDEYPVIFGNFSDLVIAQWGNVELIYDPLTKAGSNQVSFIVNAYFNFAKKHDESFQYSTFTV